MRILAMDTATTACSVALWEDGEIKSHRFEPMSRGQSEALVPMIAEVLAEVEVEHSDIDLIAVTVGPGAFTGLRIGLATARGMALAAGLPCLGVPTMEAIDAGVRKSSNDAGDVLVVLDSKRSDYFVQLFGPGGEARLAPQAVAHGGLGDYVLGAGPAPDRLLVGGDAADLGVRGLAAAGIEADPHRSSTAPDAADIATLAALRWKPGTTPEAPRPLYLRRPDAVVPKDGGRLRP